MRIKNVLWLGIIKCIFIYGLMSGSSANAQKVSFDSVKIAEIVTEATWEQFAKTIPTLTSSLETNLKSQNATAVAAQVFVEELRRALTKDNFSRAFALLLAVKLSADEQRELLNFLTSSTGKKYIRLASTNEVGLEFITPMARQACIAASARLGSSDQSSLRALCAGVN